MQHDEKPLRELNVEELRRKLKTESYMLEAIETLAGKLSSELLQQSEASEFNRPLS